MRSPLSLKLTIFLLFPFTLLILNFSFPTLSLSVAAQEVTSEEREAEASRLLEQGNQQYEANQFQDALESLQQALEIYREIGNRFAEAAPLITIARIYHDIGQYPQALDYYEQVLILVREANYRYGEGVVLNNIASVYDDLGLYEQALDYFEQSLAIRIEVGDRAGEGRTLNNMGLVYSNLGQYDKALEYHQQVLIIRHEVGDRVGEGSTLNNIGTVYADKGQYGQALDYFQQALVIRREVNDRRGEGNTLSNIGGTYELLGQYEQALDYLQQALAIHRETHDPNSEGFVLQRIGKVYRRLGQYEQALEYYQQALAIRIEIGDRKGEGTTLNSLGLVYDTLGQSEQALEYYQRSLEIAQNIGNRSGESATLNNISFIYLSLNQHEQALEYAQRSLVIAREIGDQAGESTVLANIGTLLENQGQPELAIVFFKQSVNILEEIRGNIRGLSQDIQQSYTDTVADAYRALANLLLQQDRVLEAQQVLDLLKVQELDDYLHNVRGNAVTASGIEFWQWEQEILDRYEALQQSAIALGQERAALNEAAQTRSLTAAEQARLNELDQLQQALNGQLNEFARSPEVRELLSALDSEVREQTLSISALDGLRDKLGELDAVLLYPLILDDRIELIITTPNSPPLRRTVEVGRQELNQAIVEMRQALEDPSRDAIPPAQRLYQWLIEPLEADLAQANIQTIIYAPDGPLRYIPLAALHDGDQWLTQRFRVNNITAASLQELVTQPQTEPRVLAGAFADETIVYPVQVGQRSIPLAGLPFAGQEVKGLADTLPNSTTFIDRDFSLTAIEALLNQYNILHFATHAAVVPGDASQSFILLGNGEQPTLRDIENWSLFNVDLVVLSACETGLGGFDNNGEQILGMGYLFQSRGARAVIASLWQVSDRSTQLLMNAFYAALEDGNTKVEALRQAQIALITGDESLTNDQERTLLVEVEEGGRSPQTSQLSHPYYWAPFILIGNGL